MATTNAFLTPDVIAREALMILENNLISPQVMNTDATSEFTGAKVGDQITIRKPAFFVAQEFGSNLGNSNDSVTMQDVVEHSVSLKIEKLFDVSFEVTTKELALEIDQFNARLLTPAMVAMTQQIDTYAFSKMGQLGGLPQWKSVLESSENNNNYSNAPASLETFADIVEVMNKQNIPVAGRRCILSPAMQTKMYGVDEFVRADIRGSGFSSPITEASMGRFMGLDMMMSQNLPKHTPGVAADDSSVGSLTVSAKGYEGQDSVTINGANGTGELKAGDVISILYLDDEYRDHTVMADVNLGSTVQISPPLYGHDQAVAEQGTGQNVISATASVKIKANAGGEAYTVGGAFIPDAFQLVFIPQPEPMGPGTSSATVSYNGMSLRVLQTYDHMKKKDMISVDCMVGCKAVDARLGVKVVSSTG